MGQRRPVCRWEAATWRREGSIHSVGPTSACGPCEVWWGLGRPKLQPPLPLLSPPLLTHWLSKSLPLPAAPTHQPGALITRSPRPKGMGGAVSQGTKSQLPRLWGRGPGPLNGGDGGSTGREGGVCPRRLEHASAAHGLISPQPHPRAALSSMSPISHLLSPSKQPGGSYYSFLHGIDKDTEAQKCGKVSTQTTAKRARGRDSTPAS